MFNRFYVHMQHHGIAYFFLLGVLVWLTAGE